MYFKTVLREVDMKVRPLSLLPGRIFFLGGLSLFLLGSPSSAALDPPHDSAFGTGCGSCHDMKAFDQPNLIPENGHSPLDLDDSLYNNVCWNCHDGITATLAKTHSSLQTDNRYGDWSIDCSICHNQHRQDQNTTYGSTYGKFIRQRIDLSGILDTSGNPLKSGVRAVRFLGNTGPNSFADGDGTVDGICEVCHTQTSRWRNDGSLAGVAEHSELKGSNCVACHPHEQGFRPSYECLDCHGKSLHDRADIGIQFSGSSHHVQTGSPVTGVQCHACHWEADSNGKISAYHEAVPGAPVDLVIYGAGSRPEVYAEGVTVIRYLADGTREQIRSINAHCLGCHSEQNNGVDIFGDGKSPDFYAWDTPKSSIAARYSQAGTTTWGKYTSIGTGKDQIKAFSAHGNAVANQGGGEPDTWVSTREGTENVACFDCHNSHGSTAEGVTTSYTSATPNGGILKNTFAGKGGYAMDYVPRAYSSDKGKFAFNSGAALCNDCHQTNYSGAVPWGFYETYGATRAILGYKDNFDFRSTDARITHAGGHFSASFPLTTTPAEPVNGLCTPCHDPHGVSPALNQEYAVPLLKGTWLTSTYKEDDPPPLNSSQYPGFSFDQDTFPGPEYMMAETDAEFGGLCLRCHAKTDIDPDDPGANATWKSMDRVHDAVKGWGANTQHNYPCAKCHLPHVSARLPRLMQTNCMDYRHKGRVGYNSSPYLQGTGAFPYWGGGCHGANNGYVPGQTLKEQYWNVVTRWEDRDDDDSVSYPDMPGLAGADCDDTNADIFRAVDGTCDGDGDGVLDASAGGLDCDDEDDTVGYDPAVCDQDGDGVIAWAAGGYDCDDTDPLTAEAADGFCE
ncbi:MAG: hypothetical protein Kow0089_13060 [Desulfobulbaceae bacterium]